MRTVFQNSDEVAHIWASQSQYDGRSKTGSVYFEGDTIYSYGRHFPMARITRIRGKQVVLINPDSYSNTTTQHQYSARNAVSHLEMVYVRHMWPDLPYDRRPDTNSRYDGGHKENLDYFRSRLDQALLAYGCSKLYREGRLADIKEILKKANRYCELFGLKTKFELPKDFDARVTCLVKEHREKSKKEREAIAAVRAEREKLVRQREAEDKVKHEEYLARLVLWKKNKISTVQLGYDPLPADNFSEVRLTKSRKVIETDRGAFVKVKEALGLVKLVRRNWSVPLDAYKLGKKVSVGPYTLSAVGPDSITIGCHHFRRSDLVELADRLKL